MKQLNKVILTTKITTVDDAKIFIDELIRCDKLFHFDDNPYEVDCFTDFEAYHVDSRIIEMFKIKGSWGEYEDAYGYALYMFNK